MMEAKNGVVVEPWRILREGAWDDVSESVFFTGNGALGVRGFPAWREKRHPNEHAIFRAGLFENIKPRVTDMVQLPDALELIPSVAVPESFTWELDMARGVLAQAFETPEASVKLERMVSMADAQLICQRMTLTAGRDGEYAVRAVADSRVVNLPVNDDQAVMNTETVPLLELETLTESGFTLRTQPSGHRVAYGWTLAASQPCGRDVALENGRCVTTLRAKLGAGETLVIDQRVRVQVRDEAPNADSPDPWAEHERAWAALWDECDVALEGDDALQGALRYNIYQMLCNNAANDPSVSIGARGLTHGRYKGNTFWDTDIFLFPFYLWQRPKAARNLAQYRIDRLDDARAVAQSQNLEGARYPWMCSDTGREQCESWDIGQCEIHITGDVAYALSRYEEVAGDAAFAKAVAPVYAETARYWLSRMTYEPDNDQYSTFFVKGPDEYCGVTVNNAYTNYMARHNLRLAARRGSASAEEAQALLRAADRVAIPYDPARDLFLQDETFERLPPLPVEKDEESPLYKRICYDRMQRYRALKQADLVQLMTLFPEDFTPEQKRRVFTTYEPLTLHDSTLSYGVHALLAFQLGLEDKAMDYLARSAFLDLYNVMGNTGHEGIHVAALGATWQAVVLGMLGLWSENGAMTVQPHLPAGIRRVSLKVRHRGKRYRIVATQGGALVEEV